MTKDKFLSPNRETVLTYYGNDDPSSARGKISESHRCVDCGFNTAPGCLDRKEAEIAIALYGRFNNHFTWEQEMYLVKDEVWQQTGLACYGGCLCIGCLEKRIGRRLKPNDFVPDHPFNQPSFPASRRLRKRRGTAWCGPR
jgi:hypothetical protein